ncbi:MAG: NADH-quinone oxidoreductase subunit A [Candidatus Omnitrophica bacterium]|nr:NADH-quinone oxidoreductase subunit A [Candidatus Omnitrophota bacterium]
MIEYIGIIFAFLFALAFAALLLAIPRILSPKFPSEAKSKPFECGKEPFALPGGKMPVHFYIIAMLFIIFDVELVFLFPWAVLFRELGLFGLIEMAVFMGFVILGFCYAWKKGALEWE